MSSLNKISTDQLGQRMVVRGGGGIFFWTVVLKNDVNGFPYTWDICFMGMLQHAMGVKSLIQHMRNIRKGRSTYSITHPYLYDNVEYWYISTGSFKETWCTRVKGQAN
jgi:hypothetical protein